MSHLELPRLHFRGDFAANVFTSNNDDLAVGSPSNQYADAATVTLDTHGMSDADFQSWLKQLTPSLRLPSGWNLFGDGHCQLQNASVHAVESVARQWTDDPAVDSIIGAPVTIEGAVMVDLDPEGTQGTQLFIDQLNVGNIGRLGLVGAPSRSVSRFIGLRNLGVPPFASLSACWYTAVAPDRLTIQPGSSGLLQELHSLHAAGQGLYVAFVLYLMEPRLSVTALAQDFALGRRTPNPAIGKIIGTIGSWSPTTMKSVPQGRRLNPSSAVSSSHGSFQLNPAIVHINRNARLASIDLLNCVPEIDRSLEKASLGEVQLALIDPAHTGSAPLLIAPLATDRSAYEKRSGIVDVSYCPSAEALLDVYSLGIVQSTTGAVLMLEQDYTIESDDRCVYLEEGETRTVSLRLLFKGQAPTVHVTVDLRQYVTSNRTSVIATPTTAIVSAPPQLSFPATSDASLAMVGARPGTCLLTLLPPGEPLNSRQFFLNVRVLPRDDFSGLPDSGLTFSFVYENVLRYYHVLFPAMTRFLNLSSEPAMRASAQFVLDRIDKSLFETSQFMPVSRDMSAGKRELLRRWCQGVVDGTL